MHVHLRSRNGSCCTPIVLLLPYPPGVHMLSSEQGHSLSPYIIPCPPAFFPSTSRTSLERLQTQHRYRWRMPLRLALLTSSSLSKRREKGHRLA